MHGTTMKIIIVLHHYHLHCWWIFIFSL